MVTANTDDKTIAFESGNALGREPVLKDRGCHEHAADALTLEAVVIFDARQCDRALGRTLRPRGSARRETPRGDGGSLSWLC